MLTLSVSRWRQAHSIVWQRYAGVSLAAWLYAATSVGTTNTWTKSASKTIAEGGVEGDGDDVGRSTEPANYLK